ncbi:MAG: flavin-containing monooxygenase [Acidimicrobiia bacterium]
MTSTRRTVAVIGAGFSGVAAAVAMRDELGASVTVFEASEDIGGTWRDNTYPGCACDIASHLYALSFAPNANWSATYPSQPEIAGYLHDVVERYGLRELIEFATEVISLAFDDDASAWIVTTRRAGQAVTSARFDAVVVAVGPLSRPLIGAVDGAERFEGPMFHSARWDHSVDLSGKRVAVVGTGASAIQFMPEIASVADHVTVFQRTPPWVLPRRERPYDTRTRRRFERFPMLMRAHRAKIFLRQEVIGLAFHGSRPLASAIRARAEASLRTQVADEHLRARLTPDYEPGCKRLLISNNWYPTLQRPNVTVVDHGVASIERDSVTAADGTVHRADVIVLATGFAASDFLGPLVVTGRHGVDLRESWSNGAATHLGTCIAGFPNLFMLLGPSTGLGHNSIVFMAEAQIQMTVAALRLLDRRSARSIEVRPEVQRRSYEKAQRRLTRTVWATGCRAWYHDPSGRIDTLWPGSAIEFWLRTRRVRPSHYLLDGAVNRG